MQTEVLEASCGVSWELALELSMAASSLTQSLSSALSLETQGFRPYNILLPQNCT